MMRKLFLWVGLFSLVASGAQAASYQMIDGTIVDPIQFTYGGDSDYPGIDLEPYANLTDANLKFSDLPYADLSFANLTLANLSNAYLGGTVLYSADVSGANFSGADLSDSYWVGTTTGSAFYDAATDFTGAWSGDYGNSALFDPVAAGWNLIPEPSTALLLGIGLAGLGMRRRRTRRG